MWNMGLLLHETVSFQQNICKLIKGVKAPVRHKILIPMRCMEFSVNYSAFRDFAQVS